MAEQKIRLALLDVHAIVHRAYHALPPMSRKDGTPTQAAYGFTTMLLKMLSTVKPTHVAAAIDLPGPTFRHEAFDGYKAQRKETPDDLVSQFALVGQVLEAFNIPVFSEEGFEADDVIGTIAEQAKVLPGVQTIVVTGDMDALQLVDERTKVLGLRKGMADTVLYDEEAVREKHGFGPELVPDYKGLRGDPSDNIPGVAGVGDKTARDLLKTYGSIEKIYEHIEELPKRAKGRLEGKKEEAMFSRQLAIIRRDVPLKFDLAAAKFAGYDGERVQQLFFELEFHSLVKRLPDGAKEAAAVEIAWPAHYFLADSEDKITELTQKLRTAEMVAFDTENDSLGARKYPIVGMSWAFRIGDKLEAWYVPVDRKGVLAWRDILEDPLIKKTGHNLKYDYLVLRQSGVRMQGIVFDTMMASYLLDPGSRQHSLDGLAMAELEYMCEPIEKLIGSGKGQKRVSEVPLRQLARYAAEDAEVSLRLYEVLQPRLGSQGLGRIMNDVEVPLITVLAEMEQLGVKVDGEYLNEMNTKVEHKLGELEAAIWEAAGEQFNVNSTKQLREVLFEKLRLPTVDIKRLKSGYSTAASELTKLRDSHQIIGYLEDYRELAKLQNTYIETLPLLIEEDGRIHASFNQTVAATGRLSSSDPNLQNIPVRTELGQDIRRAFMAEKGKMLVKADYSQMELRIAAALSQDEKMIEVFRSGGDIHAATAAWVYGVRPEDVTDEQRRRAKTLNFGVLYGMGAQNFARGAGISLEEARSFIGRYQDQYVKLMQYMAETVNFAKEHGYTATLWGRRRNLPEIQSSNPGVRAAAERMAFNFPIQGTEADILKLAMVRLSDRLGQECPEAAMILTVHDELVVEAPEGQAGLVGAIMKEVMEGVIELDVPIEVEVAMGANWQDTEQISR